MKTTIFKTLFIALASAFAATLFAQDVIRSEKKTAEELATIETETFSDQLEKPLTAEQMEKLKKIYLDFFTKKKELKDRQATGEDFKPLYQSREDSVKVVLTPEQFATWKENPAAKRVQEEINRTAANQKK